MAGSFHQARILKARGKRFKNTVPWSGEMGVRVAW